MALSFPIDLKLRATECWFHDCASATPIFTGYISEPDAFLTVDGDPASLQITAQGKFIIDLSKLTLTIGTHILKIHYKNAPNIEFEATLFVFGDTYILSKNTNFREFEIPLKNMSVKTIGIVIGFCTALQKKISPLADIKALRNTLDDAQIWQVYGYALSVLEFFKLREFLTYHDFDQDIVLLGGERAMIPQIYDQLMRILNIPQVINQSFTLHKATAIDLSTLVSNHKEGFLYNVVNSSIAGTIEIKEHYLHYTPPALGGNSITENLIFEVTSLTKKSAKGKIQIIYRI